MRLVSAVSLALALALVLTGPACRSRPPARVEPVAPAAASAFVEGLRALRLDPRDRDGRAREAFVRAAEFEPRWVAPRRALDEIARGELGGVEALRAHLEALARDPDDALRLYLAGRLEGQDGIARFERAAALDPDQAWAHHGLAWAASVQNDASAAVAHERDALARARDSFERSFFSATLARFLQSAKRRDEARAVLEERLADDDTRAEDRAALAIQAVGLGLAADSARERAASYERGLALLEGPTLVDAEVEELASRLGQAGSFDDPESTRLSLALGSRASPARDRLRAEILLESGATPLALGLFERALRSAGRALPGGALVRAARFAAGEFERGLESWLVELPSVVLGPDGLPREERLARVVRAARALRGAPTREALVELGQSTIDAGWFREARGVAVKLASQDLDRALALDAQALAGLDFLAGVRRLVRRVDRESSAPPPASRPASDDPPAGPRAARVPPLAPHPWPDPIVDLDGLVDALAPLVARAHVFLGGETDPRALAADLARSPRMSYAGIAELVHPGPEFSRDDERDGLGSAGSAVPGLAPILRRLGRFGLFGAVSGGGGPDATILPLVAFERRSGKHLGAEWHGTIAWCEGADLESRAGRRGARISAAALHEGYWVDIDSVRAELESWAALGNRFEGATAAERVERVLATRGLALADGAPRDERLASGALLGEAQRVRLAVLRDRGPADAVLGRMTLDELVRVTANHEEGHLCDRERFLPIGSHKLAILGFLLECGFSPTRVTEELEYRAQLTCLAVAPDPRVPLAQILESVEAGPSGLTPHAAGYRRLLRDWLARLLDRFEREPARFPGLDAGFTLAHQVHKLSPEDVRAVALDLAREKGLAAGDAR